MVTRDDLEEIGQLRAYLANEFEIKDLRSLRYFLGIEIFRLKQGIFISQQKYVLDFLKEIGLLGCKSIETPIELNHKLREKKEEATIDKGTYQRMVGKLIYLSRIRPNIAYAISVVS